MVTKQHLAKLLVGSINIGKCKVSRIARSLGVILMKIFTLIFISKYLQAIGLHCLLNRKK